MVIVRIISGHNPAANPAADGNGWAVYASLTRFALFGALASLILVAVSAATNGASLQLLTIAVLQLAVVTLVLEGRRTIRSHTRTLIAQTETDPATGCLNRRGFSRALEEAAAECREVAMLALDLDHFKRINDQYGHNVGDVVLSEVSSAVTRITGSAGRVARLGGEEFGVLLFGAGAEEAGVLGERIVRRLRGLEVSVLAPGEVVTMSIGIAAERLTSEADCAALCTRADEALYLAKRRGRDRAMLWAPGVRSNLTPAVSSLIINDRWLPEYSRELN